MPSTARRGPAVRAGVLVVLLVAGWVAAQTIGVPDVERVRQVVDDAGWWGPLAFVAGYSLWALLPAPKSVATATAGLLFGLAPGALVAWSGAMVGAVVAFGLARLLGREGVDRLLRGRLARADAALSDHGFGSVLLARLVPVLPFTVINYGAGVTGVSLAAYVAGSAVGMIPGTIAYATLGAVGDSDPRVTGAAVATLVLLSVGGWWVAARARAIRRNEAQSVRAAGANAVDAAHPAPPALGDGDV